MIKTIQADEFVGYFENSDTYKNNFTRPALYALYEHIEEYETDTAERYDFDLVQLCCEYSEFKSAWEAMEQYQPEDMPTVDNSEGMDLIKIQEASEALALEWLEEKTQVIEFNGGIIISQF